jgi:hypothetical protein
MLLKRLVVMERIAGTAWARKVWWIVWRVRKWVRM